MQILHKMILNSLLTIAGIYHVATTLNGRMQNDVKILGANYATLTKTQGSCSVFRIYFWVYGF